MTSSRESLDGKLLKWSGVAMVAFLLGSFLAAARAPSSVATAEKASAPAALHARAQRVCPPQLSRCT